MATFSIDGLKKRLTPESKYQNSARKMVGVELFFSKLSLKNGRNRAEFYDDIAVAISDGVGIVEYLRLRANRSKKMRDPLGPICLLLLSRMDSKTFGGALEGLVPMPEVVIISAAESGSSLEDNLVFLAKIVRISTDLKKVIAGSMAVPFIVLILIILMVYGFSVYFIPVLSQIYPPEKWPASGKLLKLMADFVTTYGVVTIVAIVSIISAVIWSMNGYLSTTRRMLDNYPPWSIFRAYNGSIVLISIASLTRSGMSTIDAMKRISQISGWWVSWQMTAIIRRFDHYSSDPGQAFDTGLLPQRILNRVADRAVRSGFNDALQSIGLTIISDVKTDIEKGAKLLNFIMISLAAGLLGMLMYGFLETTYSIQSAMKTY